MLEKTEMLSVFSAAIFSLFALSACNTVEGAGKDIEAAGGAIEESAEETKGY